MKVKILILLVFLMSIGLAQETVCAYYFYGDGCPVCAAIEPYLNEIEAKYPNFEMQKFETFNSMENAQLALRYIDAYNVPEAKVPIIFTKDSYYLGYNEITTDLEPYIIEHLINGSACPSLNETTKEPANFWTLMLTVTGAAFADSVNPCAIAVLIILLTTILIKSKEKVLLVGFSFILSIYTVYFLFGLGLFSALQISGLSFWFYQIIGWLAIVIGLFGVKDYFWPEKLFSIRIPKSWRPTLGTILRKATTPIGAFLIGFIVCLFELPCTGGPYFFVVGLLAEHTTQSLAIPILLYYNLIFVLPLIILTLLIGKGFKTPDEAEQWKNKNIKRFSLLTGLILIGAGLTIVLGLI